MTRKKCPYCDFQGPDNIGMEINSQSRLSEEQMFQSDWEDGYWFNYLKKVSSNGVVLVSLHTDTEFYGYDSDELRIHCCPICGRKLRDEKEQAVKP